MAKPYVADSCEIQCSIEDSGAKVADPRNCRQFYFCLSDGNPSSSPISCGPNKIFNPVKKECISGMDCEASCPPAPCQVTCPGHFGMFINHPTNCHSYYACLPDGQNIPGSCGEQYFDVNLQRCTDDRYACCECRAMCHTPNSQVEDPSDCHNFYVCDSVLNLLGPTKCPENEVFDVSTGRCSNSARCFQPCNSTRIDLTV